MMDPWQVVEIKPGLRLSVDLRIANQNSLFWFFEETEPALQWAIRTLLPTDGTFFDVGANAGLMGLLAAYDRNAKVFFVEPHPRLAQTVQNNYDLNSFKHPAHVLQWAASDREGEATLHVHDSRNDGAHTLIEFSESVGSHIVQTKRLDWFLEKAGITLVDLMKIDAEGHDYEVLVGLGEFLRPSTLPLIYVEMEHFEGFSQPIWNLLLERGYEPFSAVSAFIDTLYKYERMQQSGKSIAWFKPATRLTGGNMLWVERGSANQETLVRYYAASSNLQASD
ncbi:FkbM family methyltransferase [Candidatus Nitronereus thalassa]|uniref:FkbM family methyltransferase n=1 Tax=Candidatus Nitronereus thalassa TaxID=3020898 RepID=A0ABU3K606_9BACT|nr:FkbM family methyltransferase [Candidatus Nitronereus thalassa]MDT7041796.1 FkbM family methyltransferase [Candidatus Nitronereus thalassa]